MCTLRRYTEADAGGWDALIEGSRNGNFLHLRGYMDYHAERFHDHSLLVERKGDIVAVLPANRREHEVESHGGLTYAGLISAQALRAEATLAVFEAIAEHYRTHGIKRVLYKAVPHVFQTFPADEDLYALHRLGAQLVRRDISSVIALDAHFRLKPERRRAANKARKAGIFRLSGGDPGPFMALLTEALRKHDATPTHSAEELRLLCARFPGRIVLHEARRGQALLAGVLVYDFGASVHTQYLAVSTEGRHLDALSCLLLELIGEVYADRRYFSFGVSSEQQGRVLNAGLIEQKERFGARAVVHDAYEWRL